MRHRILFLLLLLGAFIFPWKSFRIFSASAPAATETLFGFGSEGSDPRMELLRAHGNGLGLDPDSGRLMTVESESGWIEVPLEPGAFLTTLHLSAWVEEGGTLSLDIWDPGSEQLVHLSHRRVLLHRGFNLTPHLKEGNSVRVRLSLQGRGQIMEFSIRRNKTVPFFPPLHEFFAWLLALWILFRLWFKGPAEAFRNEPTWFLVILVAAFWFRWNELAAFSLHPLEGDALGYWEEVVRWNWRDPYMTGSREPLYVILQAVCSKLGGNSLLIFRSVTVLLSLTVVGLSYVLIKRLLKNNGAALLAMGLLAVSDFMLFNSVRGEWVELNAALLLLFFIGILRPFKHIRREAVLGAVGGAFCLTWLAGLPTLLVMLVYRSWKLKLSPQAVMALTFGALVILLPHFVDHWVRFGDPLQALNAHVQYYQGGETAAAGQSWIGVLLSTLKGYFNFFLNPFSPANKALLGFHYAVSTSTLLWPVLIAGILISLKNKTWLLWLFIAATLHITPSHLDKIQDPRLFLHAAPWSAALFGLGLSTGINGLINRGGLSFRRRRK